MLRPTRTDSRPRRTPLRLRRRLLLLVAAVALVSAGSVPVGTKEAADVEPLPSAEARTMAALRDLGTALYTWLADRMDELAPEEQARLNREAREAEREGGPRKRGIYVWGWRPLRPLAYDEVVALLKPAEGKPGLAPVPRLDGWGRPFELMGWPENVFNTEVFAIRSAGPNGRFEGPRYEVGTWTSGAPSDDIVWADGFFVRWPENASGND